MRLEFLLFLFTLHLFLKLIINLIINFLKDHRVTEVEVFYCWLYSIRVCLPILSISSIFVTSAMWIEQSFQCSVENKTNSSKLNFMGYIKYVMLWWKFFNFVYVAYCIIFYSVYYIFYIFYMFMYLHTFLMRVFVLCIVHMRWR